MLSWNEYIEGLLSKSTVLDNMSLLNNDNIITEHKYGCKLTFSSLEAFFFSGLTFISFPFTMIVIRKSFS